MTLMMYLGNDLVEAVPLVDQDIPKPGYVGSFKRNLKQKYRDLLLQFPEPPEFFLMGQDPKKPESNRKAA